MTNIFRKLACALGFHGPDWTNDRYFVSGSCHRTENGFERVCPHCGALWYGCQVETRYARTLGGWERVK